MTAVEALQKARRTLDCGEGYDEGCCFFRGPATIGDNIDLLNAGGWGNNPGLHIAMASALLDGFSVVEVTAAEHTTDQPHE